MSKATLTIEGFVSADPEIRDVNGQQVATINVPHTPRRKNRDTGQFEDAGDTLWVQASFWGPDAIAVTHAARKGALVIITGQPELNVYKKNNGDTGASLRIKFATLGVIPRGEKQQQVPAQADQWASQAPGTEDAWSAGGGDFADPTPF